MEANDINDGTIITGTSQKQDEKGNVRFFFTLPSGTVMCSEWIRPEQRKEALIKWLEAVRTNIVDDLSTMRRAKIEAARAAAPKAPDGAAPGSIVPTGTSSTKTETQVTDSQDPLAYAKSQHALYSRLEQSLTEQIEQMTTTRDTNRARGTQWLKIVHALTEQETDRGQE